MDAPLTVGDLLRLHPWPQPYAAPPPSPLGDDARARLDTQREALLSQGLSSQCVDAFIGWIRDGDPMDLHRIQILERARAR